MNQPNQTQQVYDKNVVMARMRLHGLTQKQIGKHLRRSQGGIARALRGERKTLLARIVRYLDYLDRKRNRTLGVS